MFSAEGVRRCTGTTLKTNEPCSKPYLHSVPFPIHMAIPAPVRRPSGGRPTAVHEPSMGRPTVTNRNRIIPNRIALAAGMAWSWEKVLAPDCDIDGGTALDLRPVKHQN